MTGRLWIGRPLSRGVGAVAEVQVATGAGVLKVEGAGAPEVGEAPAELSAPVAEML